MKMLIELRQNGLKTDHSGEPAGLTYSDWLTLPVFDPLQITSSFPTAPTFEFLGYRVYVNRPADHARSEDGSLTGISVPTFV